MTFLDGLPAALASALATVAESGAAFLPEALDEGSLSSLSAEISAGPIRRYREQFGQVRQQIEGFDLVAPFAGFPAVAHLAGELSRAVRSEGGGISGLRTWSINEAGIVVYRPRSIGITPHLDGRRYRRLVAVVTVRGRAELSITLDRAGTVRESFDCRPGSITLLRAPGLAHVRDGRPFHAVGTPEEGERWAIGLRMTTRIAGGES